MKKKVIIVVSLVIVALILFVPIPMRLKDGGSVKYSALLYSVTDVHRMSSAMEGYEEGTIIEVLGLEVYNKLKHKLTSWELQGITKTLSLTN